MTTARHSTAGAARIGPNAILQLVAVLDRRTGQPYRDRIMTRAGVEVPPPDSGMIPETSAARVHSALRRTLPLSADLLLREAGTATADYILTHRIPPIARLIIRLLPAAWGARLLSRAIARHAWTFAGSGGFRVLPGRPLVFELTDNPLRDPDGASCHWHAAVFQRLFQRLVWPAAHVRELSCQASGAPMCRFEIRPAPPPRG